MSGSVQKAVSGRYLHIPLSVRVSGSGLAVEVSDENGKFLLNPVIEEKAFGEFIIKWKPNEVGTYKMDILTNGELKRSVKIMVDPAPVARLLGTPHLTTYIGQEVEFEVECPLDTSLSQITGKFRKVLGDHKDEEKSSSGPTDFKFISDNKFLILFCPQKPGNYSANIKIAGQALHHEPLTITALSLPSVTLLMNESTSLVGLPYKWRLQHTNLPIEQLVVTVHSPEGSEFEATVRDNHDGTLDISFTPTECGKYYATLKLDNGEFSTRLQMQSVKELPKQIDSKEFAKKPRENKKLIEPIIQKLHYHQEVPVGTFFEIHMDIFNLVEEYFLSVIINTQQNEFVFEGFPYPKSGSHHFKWKATETGHYNFQIFLDNRPISKSYSFSVVDGGNPRAEFTNNENKRIGKIGIPISLNISLDTEEAQIEAPIQNIKGEIIDHGTIKLSHINHQGAIYKVTFVPKEAGEFIMSLIVNNKPVDNSATIFRIS
eukprot:TRINITY_DN19556_c0_g1_i1.p1 TRINITY_DN19556_c0_g1~~TRINITY_DN19556_c0_g1_i1.p1  ORF type:complete len:487 (-),score=134.22 TRINITY_DN19556_c0_g1_i1:40-1500(-)